MNNRYLYIYLKHKLEGVVKSKLLSILFLIFLFLVNYLGLHQLQAQDDCNQLLINAVKEFTQANFEGTIQILSDIQNQPSVYENCTLKNKEKICFYISYCNYLLHGCSDRRTLRAICDLRLCFPRFNSEEEEYQWVSQDWINCWENSNCSVSDIIRHYYDLGKGFYDQDNFIAAAQELIYVRILINAIQRAPSNWPEYEQYKDFSEEYLNICQEKTIEAWNEYFSQENYIECLRVEKQFAGIEGYQEHLQMLSSHINDKKAEIIEKINNKTWENFRTEIESSFNLIDFIDIDFEKLQEFWNEIERYGTELLDNEQYSQNLLNAQQEIFDYFREYGNRVIQSYDIHQEERVRQTLENYRNFVINNFPDIKSEVEKEYEAVINTLPIFNRNDIGVKPPGRDWNWRIRPPDCAKRENIEGYVKFGVTIDSQGNVENVQVVENKLNVENYCSKRFVDDLINYLSNRKFTPALKILYRSARASLPEKIDKRTINVKYYIVKKFSLK